MQLCQMHEKNWQVTQALTMSNPSSSLTSQIQRLELLLTKRTADKLLGGLRFTPVCGGAEMALCLEAELDPKP